MCVCICTRMLVYLCIVCIMKRFVVAVARDWFEIGPGQTRMGGEGRLDGRGPGWWLRRSVAGDMDQPSKASSDALDP